jgi:cobalt-zinc-cadmium resistance protein CzcA
VIERIPGLSLRHPAAVLLGGLALVAAGGRALSDLTIDAMPDITTVQVQVLTRAPALGPLEVEQFITRPVESAMSGLPNLEQVRSISRYGISAVTVVFADGTDLYFVRQLVSERLAAAQESLAPGVERPELGPAATGLGEVFRFLVEGAGRTPMELRGLLDWDIAYRLRSVPGVVEVNPAGGFVEQYQVLVDPAQLLAQRIGLPEVADAVERNNVVRGGGILERGGEGYVVRGDGAFASTDDIARVVVASRGRGEPVLLRQVAEVRRGPALRIGAVTRNGEGEGVMGLVMMRAGANARQVVSRVEAEIDDIRRSLPSGVRIVPFYNREQLVSDVIYTVGRNLTEGGLLVIAVLLLLLGNLRGGLIVASAIPLSMLGAVMGMVRGGLSGNLMSLGALDFGLIVDGSVVMVDNVVRRLALARDATRRERWDVVARAAGEVARPVVFGVGIILIVYLPILSLSGIEGKMFRPMAWTVVLAVGASLVLALTLVPVLCALLLGGRIEERETWLLRKLHEAYRPLLAWHVARPRVTVLVAAAVFLLSLGLAGRLGAVFVPQLQEGDLLVRVDRPSSVGLAEAVRGTTEVEKVLRRFPEVTTVVSRTGSPEVATEPEGFDRSEVFVGLRPRSEWRPGLTQEGLVREMDTALEAGVPGAAFSFSQPIEDRFEDLIAGVRSDVGVKIFGDDLGVLAEKGRELAGILDDVPGAAGVRVEPTTGLPILRVRVDRDRLAQAGVAADTVLAAVEAARSGRVVGSVYEGRRRLDVVVRLAEGAATSAAALGSVPVLTPDGRPIPLSQLCEIAVVEGPAQISRERYLRRIAVEANVRGCDLAGFVADARRAVRSRLHLPTGYYVTWGGQYEHLAAAVRRLLVAVPTALVLIFLLLYATFGSAHDALLIFLNVPMAATGGILSLWLRGMPFSVSAGVGFIALFGVAVLNGVVLVSVVRRLRAEGRPPLEAAVRAAEARLRPILMTALVASLGFVPMALATGPGAEVQRPLATVVIGGLVTSTLLTLVVLPAAYRWLARGEAVHEQA